MKGSYLGEDPYQDFTYTKTFMKERVFEQKRFRRSFLMKKYNVERPTYPMNLILTKTVYRVIAFGIALTETHFKMCNDYSI